MPYNKFNVKNNEEKWKKEITLLEISSFCSFPNYAELLQTEFTE